MIRFGVIGGLFGGLLGLACGVIGLLCFAALAYVNVTQPWTILVYLFVWLEYRWIRNGFRKDRARREARAEAEVLRIPSALDD